MLNYAIISGSHREISQSSKVAKYCDYLIKKNDAEAATSLTELADNPLPFWDESFWEKDPKWEKTWGPIRKRLQAADALVVVSPEWNGMAPAGLKNLFLFCSNQDVGHKPAIIVTVSSGQGGAYPVTELRASGYKNNRICYIPDHVIVRHAESVLNNTDQPESKDDELIRIRLSYSLNVLKEYAVALRQVRKSNVINFKDFSSGM